MNKEKIVLEVERLMDTERHRLTSDMLFKYNGFVKSAEEIVGHSLPDARILEVQLEKRMTGSSYSGMEKLDKSEMRLKKELFLPRAKNLIDALR